MAICVLPPSTTRLLGSSVVITNPVSLVKELVDNGIDAGATSVDVNISPNTVDRIQVRDNGQGIQIEDFECLGRRAHTSKLRTYEELETKGGQTLGFRGEALASANSLATVKIITRTARDPVASLVVLRSGDGGVERKQAWSAPIGTTVHALKLFDNLPVRRQTALKESRKTLLAIRRLLETYALALPRLKLSLKVPGDSHQTWSYSPCTSSNTREAVTQIFGHALVAQCVEFTAPLRTGTEELTTGSTWGSLTAFIPKPDAHLATIKDKGTFISIDSRPILSSRGLGKKIAAVFKKQLMGALRLGDSTKSSMPNPFMQLSINCHPGSYDPNVSPLKDEVIMKEKQMLLDCFEALCDQVYKSRESPNRAQIRTKLGSQDNRFNARASPASGQSSEWERGTRGCFVSETALTGIGSPDVDVADSPIDDIELLEAFGDERSAAAVASCHPNQSETELGDQQAHAYVQDKNEELDAAGNRNTVSVLMRMVSKVNLARTGSNTSDKDCTTGLVPVQVAPRRTTTQTANQYQSGRKHNGSAPARQLKGIGRYFQPKRDQPMEIASDETATFGNLHNEGESTIFETPSQSRIGRQPLGELSDSLLNTLGEDDEEEAGSEAAPDVSSPEPDILLDHNIPREDLVDSTERGIRVATGRVLAASNGHHGRALLSSRTPPRSVVRGQRRVRGLLDMPPADGFPAMQTPPSSCTLPDERISNTQQFAVARNNVFSTRSQIPPERVSRQTENVVPADGRRQTVIPFLSGSRGQDSGCNITGPRERRVLGSSCRGSPSLNLDQQDVFFQGASQHPNFFQSTAGKSNGQHDGQWARMSQVLLMKAPAPPSERSYHGSRSGTEGPDDVSSLTQGYDTPSDRDRLVKRRRSQSRSKTPTREDRDPRRYYMSRRSRSPRSPDDRFKRLNSEMLPLETTATKDETRQLSLRVRMGLNRLKQLIRGYMALGQDFQAWNDDSPLQFRDMEEARVVESGLKKAVSLWLGGEDGTDVEYTMQSGVRGKAKA
ncbi:hypothetical protein B0J13DRAFT_76434 [Dactylonectria estremocensis]|uniref:DNA mismatch repair protein S5 domain-containing protein n=1 Tax=Dactylonectria estremocensis TaxID=1079267 RepID=A0A9P9EIF0_9HYPO|nr:hypothetical protein B0J13DRAFT_76434 [Dactylonectria estremocensis]